MTHPRAAPPSNPLSPEVAGDLRRLRDLLRDRRASLIEAEPSPDPSELDQARDDARRLHRFTQFLLTLVEELRSERASLMKQLEDRERIDELHAKFEDLSAFAAQIRPDLEAWRRQEAAQPARRPARVSSYAATSQPPAPLEADQPSADGFEDEEEWPQAPAYREFAATRARSAGPRATRAPSDRSLHPALRRA